ncbi:hypothetical protein Cch01nite_17000 [Cellulomonas chitinilytica]|uniref:Uncharacterized protein n=1 Tax=Cellulomonas chitinilytica TaxID=398759 RepID=A0A919U120_9CELL|nr:hypothetical protein [Cellulomonas chitinilytica]GIG20976.1 hypothetical protein Cch01nite_17000 [Cellulomonas chitinilytica]
MKGSSVPHRWQLGDVDWHWSPVTNDVFRGEFLVDDRPHKNGADRFPEHGGEVIHFGPGGTRPTWPDVVAYLKERA